VFGEFSFEEINHCHRSRIYLIFLSKIPGDPVSEMKKIYKLSE
jgi:hypothetical protein